MSFSSSSNNGAAILSAPSTSELHISRPIATLPLAPSLLNALQSGGFIDTQELMECTPRQLSRELRISMENALAILTEVKTLDNTSGYGNTGSELIKALPSTSLTAGNSQSPNLTMTTPMNLPIITFCKGIDTLLGGGVSSGQITELCGVPGIGKTQMAMQLALDVQIPSIFRGCGGEAIYIDTEGSCLPTRLKTMAEALVKHLQQIAQTSVIRQSQLTQMTQNSNLTPEEYVELQRKQDITDRKIEEAKRMTVASLLSGIHMFRTHDQTELLAVIAQLSSFLENHPKVKLIVIDSIAYPFRADISNQSRRQDGPFRARILSTLAQDLYRNALQHRLAVVVVNHVTTKFFQGENADGHASNTQIIPSLGELWSHSITSRLMLHWESTSDKRRERVAYLEKSPSRPSGRAYFTILQVGLRDMPRISVEENTQSSEPDIVQRNSYSRLVQNNDKTRLSSEIESQGRNDSIAKRNKQEYIPSSLRFC